MKEMLAVLGFLIIIGILALKHTVYHYVTKHQITHADSKSSCGTFNKYEKVNESQSRKIENINTYLYITSDSGDKFKFKYHGRFHQKFNYIKSDLKHGQRVCFEYIHPYFEDKFGENFLKTIELKGNTNN